MRNSKGTKKKHFRNFGRRVKRSKEVQKGKSGGEERYGNEIFPELEVEEYKEELICTFLKEKKRFFKLLSRF